MTLFVGIRNRVLSTRMKVETMDREVDVIVERAIAFAKAEGKVSPLSLQRKFSINLLRAMRIMGELEGMGLIAMGERNTRPIQAHDEWQVIR